MNTESDAVVYVAQSPQAYTLHYGRGLIRELAGASTRCLVAGRR